MSIRAKFSRKAERVIKIRVEKLSSTSELVGERPIKMSAVSLAPGVVKRKATGVSFLRG